jgi:hypothetical protein
LPSCQHRFLGDRAGGCAGGYALDFQESGIDLLADGPQVGQGLNALRPLEVERTGAPRSSAWVAWLWRSQWGDTS